MTIGRCSVKTLAKRLAKSWQVYNLSRSLRFVLAEEVEQLVNAIVARELAKAQKGKK